jgi:hypothetical protein
MTGPEECVSIIMRWGIPRPRRDADSKAAIAAVVSEERACNCDCVCEGGLGFLGEGKLEVDRMGVSARSARCNANWLLEDGRFAMA